MLRRQEYDSRSLHSHKWDTFKIGGPSEMWTELEELGWTNLLQIYSRLWRRVPKFSASSWGSFSFGGVFKFIIFQSQSPILRLQGHLTMPCNTNSLFNVSSQFESSPISVSLLRLRTSTLKWNCLESLWASQSNLLSNDSTPITDCLWFSLYVGLVYFHHVGCTYWSLLCDIHCPKYDIPMSLAHLLFP